jgi:DNA-binding transcriptional LysR family regulator
MGQIAAEDPVGRRLKLRDLQVFFAVVHCGSMAKAASELGLTQPAVSDIVAGLEQMFSVRLFDRNPRGVAPTIYGHALLKRGERLSTSYGRESRRSSSCPIRRRVS